MKALIGVPPGEGGEESFATTQAAVVISTPFSDIFQTVFMAQETSTADSDFTTTRKFSIKMPPKNKFKILNVN